MSRVISVNKWGLRNTSNITLKQAFNQKERAIKPWSIYGISLRYTLYNILYYFFIWNYYYLAVVFPAIFLYLLLSNYSFIKRNDSIAYDLDSIKNID